MKLTKIAVFSHYAPDSFSDNVAFTLKAMGYSVLPVESDPDPLRRNWGLLLRELYVRAFPGPAFAVEHMAISRILRAKPQLLLACTALLHPSSLDRLKRAGIRTALWWGDHMATNRHLGILDRQWDVVFLKDPLGLQKLRLAGVNGQFLFEAMNPAWHRPVTDKPLSGDSLVVAGNSYAFRQALVTRLIEDRVKVALYGNRPPRWANPTIRSSHLGVYIRREVKSRIFGEGLACLNSFHLPEQTSLNCRAFEIAGAGGLQLIENRPMVSECFEPNKEILTFDTYEELLGLLERIPKDRKRMLEIAAAGARRAAAEHTYEIRLKQILKTVSEL